MDILRVDMFHAVNIVFIINLVIFYIIIYVTRDILIDVIVFSLDWCRVDGKYVSAHWKWPYINQFIIILSHHCGCQWDKKIFSSIKWHYRSSENRFSDRSSVFYHNGRKFINIVRWHRYIIYANVVIYKYIRVRSSVNRKKLIFGRTEFGSNLPTTDHRWTITKKVPII